MLDQSITKYSLSIYPVKLCSGTGCAHSPNDYLSHITGAREILAFDLWRTQPNQDSALLSRSEYWEDKAYEKHKRPDLINTQTDDSGHEVRGERVEALWMQRSGKSSWKRNKLIKLSVLGFEGRMREKNGRKGKRKHGERK